MSLNTSKLLLAIVLISTTPAWAVLTVNANGTVTDTTTSLVWDQCTYGLTGATCASGSALLANWPTALTMATGANAANYKGFNDWRVPNVQELESIVKIDTSNPAIDAVAFPNTPSTGRVWSSTSFAPSPASAWVVRFNYGIADTYGTTQSVYVRLVRSGQFLADFDLLGATPVNGVPTATALALTGTTQFGQVLTGAYVYADAEFDAQDTSGTGSSYRFVRSTDTSVATTGDNTDVASGATGGVDKTYTAQAADVGKYLFYCVTPKALTGASPGLEACSSPMAAITALPQAITGFAPTSPVVFGAAPASLSATGGGSNNPVTFATTSAASICTVAGTQLTYVGLGICNLTADQAGGNGYSAAPQVTASVSITAASQTINNFAPASSVVLGAAPVTLTATGGASGNPVVFATTSAASICTVAGTQLTYVGVGVCNLTANQAAGGNYSAAPQVTASVTINAAPVGAVTAIPTLSEWGMMLLSGLMALLGLDRLRRQAPARR